MTSSEAHMADDLAYDKGCDARREGKQAKNPYPISSSQGDFWAKGWLQTDWDIGGDPIPELKENMKGQRK